jgi:hypothetical protein
MCCVSGLSIIQTTPQIVRRNANVFQVGVKYVFRFNLKIFISDRISLFTNRISNIQIMLLIQLVNRQYLGK